MSSTTIIKQIEKITKNENLQAYIDNALSINFGNDYPYLSYFGINYNENGLLNFKVYFAFFRRLEKNEINVLLPDVRDFYLHYNDWEDSKLFDLKHTGCSFALKINTNEQITNYFHFRTNQLISDLPKKITLTNDELNLNQQTYCCEYNDSGTFNKNYSLIFDRKNIKTLLDRFKINFFDQSNYLPYLIEYTETEKWDKIILAIDDLKNHNKFKNEILDENIKEVIDYFSEKYGLMSASPGFYSDGKTRSIYFVEKNPKIYLQSTNTIQKLRNTFFSGNKL